MWLICLLVFKIEEFVQKIDDPDTAINTASENMKEGPITEQEIETFKSNVLLRYKLN